MVEKPGEKFGDLLVKSGLIDELQLQAALGHQRRWGGKLGQCLIDLGFVTESELLAFVSEQFKMPAIDLSQSRISEQAFAALPESVAKKYGVVPVFLKDAPGKKKILTLAMSDPSNLKVLDEVQFLTGLKVEPVLANESAIARVIEHYGNYKPEEISPRQRTDVARPSDLRKEHARPPKAAAPAKQEAKDKVELILGGSESADGMTEILDLVEADQEGVEIAPDEDVQIIKDEVVMVRADMPKAKAKAKAKAVSPTERAPTRAPIRERIDRIPEIEHSQASPAPAPAKTGAEAQFLNVPDLGDSAAPAARPSKPEPQPGPDAPKRGIEMPEYGDDKMEVAAAHEFMQWQPTEQEKPAPVKTVAPEEKLELAAAHEFMQWQPQEEPEPTPPQTPDLTPAPAKAAEAETGPAATEEPQAADQELTHKLSKPETAEDDFWAEHDQAAPSGESADEESLPFERQLEPEPPPPPPPQPPPTPEQPQEPMFAPPQQPAANLQDFSSEEGDPFEKPLAASEPEEQFIPAEVVSAQVPEQQIIGEHGEKSLEFALDELLNLMMKKEMGEITAEIFMKEMAVLKKEIEKIKAKKSN